MFTPKRAKNTNTSYKLFAITKKIPKNHIFIYFFVTISFSLNI